MLSFVKPEATCSILYDWNQRPQNIPHLFFDVISICSNNKNLCQLTVRKNIKEYSLGRPWVHGYDSTIVGAWQHLRHTLGAKVGNNWLVGSHGDPIQGCPGQEGRMKGDRITGVFDLSYTWDMYINTYIYIY